MTEEERERSRRNRAMDKVIFGDSCDKRRDGGKDEHTGPTWEGTLSQTASFG